MPSGVSAILDLIDREWLSGRLALVYDLYGLTEEERKAVEGV